MQLAKESVCESESAFKAFMRGLSDGVIFFEPLQGNNGDRLILEGAQQLFRDLNINMVGSPREAKAIVINGGAAMTDIWENGGLTKLEMYRREFPDKPLIVAPSTYRSSVASLIRSFSTGSAPLYLFARERYSQQSLLDLELPSRISIHLSQDLAFELRGAQLIESLKKRSASLHILAAMRKDREGGSGLLRSGNGKWLPAVIRKPLSLARDYLIGRSCKDIDPMLALSGVEGTLPVLYRDVAASVAFDEFLQAIAHSAAIITDRLHVGILGHLLGKRVILGAGSYFKIRGVYELSMSFSGSNTILYEPHISTTS